MLTISDWHILVVDDDEDVHAVTDLALKYQQFFGVKCKLHHAMSGKQARAMLAENEELRRIVAVCIIDVIMETPTAGLELCNYVRSVQWSTQLVLRTGQPGMAPARDIVDQYDISAYLAKAEATPDNLYVTLKPRIQSVLTMRQHMRSNLAWNAVHLEARTEKDAPEIYFRVVNSFARYGKFNAAWDFGDQYFGFDHFADRQTYESLKSQLLERASEQLKAGSNPFSQANPYAEVDGYVVIETKVPGHAEHARLVLKDPTYPPGQLGSYAMAWRHDLAVMAKAVWSGR